MRIPMQITFHGLPHSQDIESKITEAAEKLDRIFGEIMSCRVVVDLDNRRHKRGNLYRIHIDVSVPGTELYVGREPGDRNAHKDAFVAIRDAFNAMERQLQEYGEARRGEAKKGVAAPHGRISELLTDQGSGSTEPSDARSMDFRKNGVVNQGFDQLAQGSESIEP
jgi:ribosome-associated translation inhibitor RaiA